MKTLFTEYDVTCEQKAAIVQDNLGDEYEPDDDDIARPWMFGEWNDNEDERFVGASYPHQHMYIYTAVLRTCS